MKYYQISVRFVTEDEISPEAIENFANIGKQAHVKAVELGSIILDKPEDKVYFLEAVVAEIKFEGESKKDEEETPAPVLND